MSTTALLPGTKLEAGNVVPGTELTDAVTGSPVTPWAHRQRAAQVLIFVHPSCRACASFLSRLEEEAGDDIRTTGGRLAAVAADAGGADRFVDPEDAPVVIVLDRYAAAWSSYPAHGHDFPAPSEVAATLWHLATMCPECGVSTWD